MVAFLVAIRSGDRQGFANIRYGSLSLAGKHGRREVSVTDGIQHHITVAQHDGIGTVLEIHVGHEIGISHQR